MRMRTFAITAAFLTLAVLAAMPADAKPLPGGEPQCMQVYQEYDLGPVRIVRRDSCHTEYYVCGRTPGEAAAAPNPLDCLV